MPFSPCDPRQKIVVYRFIQHCFASDPQHSVFGHSCESYWKKPGGTMKPRKRVPAQENTDHRQITPAGSSGASGSFQPAAPHNHVGNYFKCQYFLSALKMSQTFYVPTWGWSRITLKCKVPLTVLNCSTPGVVTRSDSMDAAYCSQLWSPKFSHCSTFSSPQSDSCSTPRTLSTGARNATPNPTSPNFLLPTFWCFLSEAQACALFFFSPKIEANF